VMVCIYSLPERQIGGRHGHLFWQDPHLVRQCSAFRNSNDKTMAITREKMDLNLMINFIIQSNNRLFLGSIFMKINNVFLLWRCALALFY